MSSKLDLPLNKDCAIDLEKVDFSQFQNLSKDEITDSLIKWYDVWMRQTTPFYERSGITELIRVLAETRSDFDSDAIAIDTEIRIRTIIDWQC